jgi:hypothetical protein
MSRSNTQSSNTFHRHKPLISWFLPFVAHGCHCRKHLRCIALRCILSLLVSTSSFALSFAELFRFALGAVFQVNLLLVSICPRYNVFRIGIVTVQSFLYIKLYPSDATRTKLMVCDILRDLGLRQQLTLYFPGCRRLVCRVPNYSCKYCCQ